MITYSAQEASKILGIDRHLMPVLFKEKMLLGIKTGRGRRYSEKELDEFWEMYKGEDISSAEQIRLTAALHRTKKADPEKSRSAKDNRMSHK